MNFHMRRWLPIALVASSATLTPMQAQSAMDPDKARVIEYWTSERRAQAIPRDLVIDSRGLGYLKRPDGSLVPHGHSVAALAQDQSPRAAPGGGDKIPPAVSEMNPGAGATIGASYTFSATVTDASGVRSVTFKLQKTNSQTIQSFAAAKSATSNTWSVGLQGFTDGGWKWWVEAKDAAAKGGNTTVTSPVLFTVNTSSSGGGAGGTGGIVTNAHWTSPGIVVTATGRLYFEMPGNANRSVWWGYVCSGTVASEATAGRSVIITAAHCVYDDANKAFARNVMFIPDQDATLGTATDRNCDNDPMGCWIASFGVVDANWTTRTFPDNVAWDYAYYVVADSGAHRGSGSEAALGLAAGSLAIDFGPPEVNDGIAGSTSPDFTYALGYSASDDPKLMYCAEDMTQASTVNWWLPSCGLSGGSSGGPWIQPMSGGAGPIISVNSWGYTNSPGMAGPKLSGSAKCVFDTANTSNLLGTSFADGSAGATVNCP